MSQELSVATPVLNETTTEVEKKPRKYQAPEPTVKSTPSFERQLTLSTLQAQRVYLRTVKLVPRALFNLDVIMHIIGNSDDTAVTEKMVREAMNDVEKKLKDTIAQCQQILTDSGIEKTEEPLNYSSVMNTTVTIQSPLTLKFYNLVTLLDSLVKHIDTIWMTGNMDSGNRTNTIIEWQRSLLKLANNINNIQRRAYIAAVNKGRQAELDKANLIAMKDTSEAEVAVESEEAEEAEEAEVPLAEAVAE